MFQVSETEKEMMDKVYFVLRLVEWKTVTQILRKLRKNDKGPLLAKIYIALDQLSALEDSVEESINENGKRQFRRTSTGRLSRPPETKIDLSKVSKA